MPISAQEQADLDLMHKARLARQVQMYDRMMSLSRTPTSELKHSGFKTLEEGILWTFNNAARDIDKLVKAHLKKYPD